MQSPKPFSQLFPLDPSNDPIPLPTPPGPYQVGTVSLEATDTSRIDPFGPVPHHRRLMLSFFYPTTDDQHPFAPYFSSPKLAARYDETDHVPCGTTARYQPQVYDQASVLATGPLPVLLFSTGGGVTRENYTVMLGDLASQGYFCVSIGQTYETDIHFPDGEIVWRNGWADIYSEEGVRVRAEDAIFALRQLADGAFVGRIPGLGPQTLETDRVGMFGHSMGGIAALEAMRLDPRIAGGVNLDGMFRDNQVTVGTDRPFLLITGKPDEDNPEYRSAITKIWPNLKGWKTELQLVSARHMSFCDFATRYKLLDLLNGIDPKKESFGTIDPSRMLVLQSAYLAAFFDFVLKKGSDDIFGSPDPRFPEVAIVKGQDG
jgi:hypothetical protein